jgi:hypothetical protein
MPALIGPAKILQRIVPLLVTLEITDKPSRLLLTRGFFGYDLGCLALKGLKHAGSPHFVSLLQAGPLAYAIEEDADRVRNDAMEDEGNAIDYP